MNAKDRQKVLKRSLVDPDNPNRMQLFDTKIAVPVVIDSTHHEIHEGDHYFIKTFLEVVGIEGTTNYFCFQTPNNGKRIHAKAIMAPDVDTEINIYEDASVTEGTPISSFNCDRESEKTAVLIAKAAPTIIDLGTKLWASRTGGGKNPVGVAPGLNYEIIAKRGSTYLFEIIKRNNSGDLIIDIDFFWYEHGDE